MDHFWIIWLVAAIIFAIIELTNSSFFIIWFSVGALAAMLISLIIPNIALQFLIFLVILCILLFSTRKITGKFIHNKPKYKTNVDKLINSQGIVTEEINNSKGTGQIYVNGEFWSALSESNTIIPVDSKVIVINVQGVKVLVEKDVTLE
jgi:membrane protein implicated in regulation of membrane protease activity